MVQFCTHSSKGPELSRKLVKALDYFPCNARFYKLAFLCQNARKTDFFPIYLFSQRQKLLEMFNLLVSNRDLISTLTAKHYSIVMNIKQ